VISEQNIILDIERSINPYTTRGFSQLPDEPHMSYDDCLPTITRVGDDYHVKCVLCEDISFTVNDGVHMNVNQPTYAHIQSSNADVLLLWIDIDYIGFWEGRKLAHYLYIWLLDKETAQFTSISQDRLKELGFTILPAQYCTECDNLLDKNGRCPYCYTCPNCGFQHRCNVCYKCYKSEMGILTDKYLSMKKEE
jgi:hypothetical protein